MIVGTLTIASLLFAMLLAGCGAGTAAPTLVSPATSGPPLVVTADETVSPAQETATPTALPEIAGLSEEQAATLDSLELVDDYPLYTMRYYGAYETATTTGLFLDEMPNPRGSDRTATRSWACSLFAALGEGGEWLYGRNFDWDYSPSLLLFTDPPDGYASVSMVDIAYLGFSGDSALGITELSLTERQALLESPFWPFDGLNEYGMAVGMAAVPAGQMQMDPEKETLGSLGIMREILDHARDVDEAVALFQRYNVDMGGGGPPLHYLVSDASGRAVLVEYRRGEMVIIENEQPYHLATNFLRSSFGESATGQCPRYDRIEGWLSETQGQATAAEAMDVLSQVSQEITEWSILYGIRSGDIRVAVNRQYDQVHTFHLDMVSE